LLRKRSGGGTIGVGSTDTDTDEGCDLPIFQDVYKLILKLFEYTKDIPREYKFTLGQDMKSPRGRSFGPETITGQSPVLEAYLGEAVV
jgi:hypothetical protein